MSFCR